MKIILIFHGIVGTRIQTTIQGINIGAMVQSCNAGETLSIYKQANEMRVGGNKFRNKFFKPIFISNNLG